MITTEQRRRIRKRDQDRCHYCARTIKGRQLQIDHRLAQCQGGPDEDYNLVVSCKTCNREKGKTDYETYVRRRYQRCLEHINQLSRIIQEIDNG